MNDFTKEELIALKNGIEYLPDSVSLDKNYSAMCNVILGKLTVMIDNYCEHEGEDVEYSPGLYNKILADKELTPQDLIRFRKCNKCGEFYR